MNHSTQPTGKNMPDKKPKLGILTNEYFWIILILLTINILFFHKLAIGSHVFMGGDSMAPTAMNAGIKLAEEKYGEYPEWFPWIFSGLPTTQSFINISHHYLPQNLISFLTMMGLPAFWNFLLHYLFAGIGMYILMKRLGAGMSASLLSGISFMVMPYMVTMIVHGHGSQMMTASYIPWVLWALIRVREMPGFQTAGILALLAGLQLQRGHIQIAYYTWLMAGLYLLIWAIDAIRQKSKREFIGLGFAAGALGVGLGLAMSIYLPVTEYTPYSIRGTGAGGGTGFEYATQWSFSFGEMMTFLLPSFYGFGGPAYWGGMPFTDYPNYMGILVLQLGIYGLIYSKLQIRWFLLVTALLALLLSFGKNFFLYQFFYNLFPYFNKFRVPVMFLILTQFCFSGLAGLGFSEIIRQLKDEQNRKRFLVIFMSVAGLGLVLLVLGGQILNALPIPSSQYAAINELRLSLIESDTLYIMVILLAASGILLITHQRWLPLKVGISAVLILSLADMGNVDFKIIQPEPETYRTGTLRKMSFRENYLAEDEIIRHLQENEHPYRILPLGRLQGETRFSAFGIESVGGYHPAKLANYNRILSDVGFNTMGMLQMLNVQFLLSPEKIQHPLFEEQYAGDYMYSGTLVPLFVYRFKNSFPRIFPVSKIRLIPDPAEQLMALKKGEFDPRSDSFVSEKLSRYSWNPALVSVENLKWTPNEISVDVQTGEPQFLVFSEVYYPAGWEALVDGVPQAIVQVNSFLRGLEVPAGHHTVEMRFEPGKVQTGKLVSVISLLIILTSIILPVFIKKHRQTPQV